MLVVFPLSITSTVMHDSTTMIEEFKSLSRAYQNEIPALLLRICIVAGVFGPSRVEYGYITP